MPRKNQCNGYYRVYYNEKQFYGKTLKEAKAKRDAYVALEKEGVDLLNHETSRFLPYAERWINVFCTTCAEQQRKQYRSMLRYCAEQLPEYIKDITIEDIQKMLNAMSSYSPSYISKCMTSLRGVFSLASAEGVVLRNPMAMVRRPKTKPLKGHRALEQWERELVRTTWSEHEFGPVAMVMMYAGLRRGEALYLDVDRDVDFERKSITVHGAVSYPDGMHPVVTDGKTANARRTIPMVRPLEEALTGKHGLLMSLRDDLVTMDAFDRRYQSYLNFLEFKANSCQKRWYGRTREHQALLEAGKELPPWREVKIRCHDFRVDFCTRNYEAGIPIKTLEKWMGHADAQMIMNVYAKLTEEKEKADELRLREFMEQS